MSKPSPTSKPPSEETAQTTASTPTTGTPMAGAAAKGTPRGEFYAAAIALVVAAPLVYALATALADGVLRDRQTPLRALLGNERYEALASFDECARASNAETLTTSCGELEVGFPHYSGNAFRAPDFTVQDHEGHEWKLADQRGKTLIVNFWSITCPPCLEEMPSVEVLAHMVEARDDIEVITITPDEDPQEAFRVIGRELGVVRGDGTVDAERLHARYLFDPGGEVVKDVFGTNLFPETWVIDERGVIRLRYDGARDWSSPLILDVIEQL